MDDREWEALTQLWGREQRIDVRRLAERARRERRWWLAWAILDLLGIALTGIAVILLLLSTASVSFKVMGVLMAVVVFGYLPLSWANWRSQLPREVADPQAHLGFQRRQIQLAQRYVRFTWWAMALLLLLLVTWGGWFAGTADGPPSGVAFYLASALFFLGGILFNLWLNRWVRRRRRELDGLERLLKECA